MQAMISKVLFSDSFLFHTLGNISRPSWTCHLPSCWGVSVWLWQCKRWGGHQDVIAVLGVATWRIENVVTLSMCPFWIESLLFRPSKWRTPYFCPNFVAQFWVSWFLSSEDLLPRQGKTSKTRIATVQRGYHGDTFGAMSVCDPVRGMHTLFKETLAQQLFADPPALCTDPWPWWDKEMSAWKPRCFFFKGERARGHIS